MTDLKVLLVDDETDFIDALSKRLAIRGLNVDTVSCGLEALSKVADSDYDAIVLDLAMPDMDGLETLKRLLAEKPGLPVILLTGHPTPKISEEAAKRGAADFLEKPMEINDLLEKIKAVHGRRLVVLPEKCQDVIEDLLKKQV
ncbi:MAG: response regulator [Deltaproteobacteria bacterium]|nr:response regulator [Deltaproteobacteria bacterium]